MGIVLILAVLILVLYIKYTGNKDIAKQCCKNETDIANVKNARKTYSKSKESTVLIILSIVTLIVSLILDFTDIDYVIRDFISTDFVEKFEFNRLFYLTPIYILVCRQIVIEVKVSEFLYKFFNVEEPEIENNPLKSILFKNKKNEDSGKSKIDQLLEQEGYQIEDKEEVKEEQLITQKEEIKVEDIPLEREQENIELPEIKQ